jgi:hypothetical protein
VNGNYAIFVEAASGGKAVQATDCRLNANHGVWSPDGARFLFSYAFGNPAAGRCAGGGCRGIAIAPVPAKIRNLADPHSRFGSIRTSSDRSPLGSTVSKLPTPAK